MVKESHSTLNEGLTEHMTHSEYYKYRIYHAQLISESLINKVSQNGYFRRRHHRLPAVAGRYLCLVQTQKGKRSKEISVNYTIASAVAARFSSRSNGNVPVWPWNSRPTRAIPQYRLERSYAGRSIRELHCTLGSVTLASGVCASLLSTLYLASLFGIHGNTFARLFALFLSPMFRLALLRTLLARLCFLLRYLLRLRFLPHPRLLRLQSRLRDVRGMPRIQGIENPYPLHDPTCHGILVVQAELLRRLRIVAGAFASACVEVVVWVGRAAVVISACLADERVAMAE